MVTLESMGWNRGAWELNFSVQEGVYHLNHYSVRITHLAFSKNDVLRDTLAKTVVELLRRHMRSGNIPPHGMVLNWSRAGNICNGGTEDMTVGCQYIERSSSQAISRAISNHF